MTNKRNLLLASAMLCVAMGYAQRTPTHPLDIKDTNFSDILANLETWEPGNQPIGVSRIDDEFYISRVRPLKRITDNVYQANNVADPKRKFCLWTPLDDPTSSWKALPRYCFEGDNFSMWSYLDIHGNWTAPWFRVTAGLSDVAHKNGVKVGCVLSIPWAASVYLDGGNIYSKIFTKLTERDDNDNFKNVDRFVRLLKYYGIDGIGVNSEFGSDYDTMSEFQEFIAECHKKAEEIGWAFQLHWYDGTNDNGAITFDQGLGSHNKGMFGAAGHVVTDMMFSNYNTGKGTLQNSAAYAESMGRDPYDYYKGFDIQGRDLSNFYNADWRNLEGVKASIGFWGAHSQGLIHQSATDYGTSDVAIQKAYLEKQELIFSGANRNPANVPAVNGTTTLANASLKNNFHGVARFNTAKSTIQAVPFVSRFNLGNGLKFRSEGKVTFDHKWHNLNTQDILPTWRWWVVNAAEQAPTSGLVNAELTWDDAYWGGSCLRLSGATDLSRVKLYRTSLTVEPTYNISVTYKMNNELDTHAKLFVALKDNVTSYKEIDIPAAEKFGEWTTFTTTLDKLGIKSGDNIALIGITTENTAADYSMLVGELAVRNPQQNFAPVAPEVKEVEVLRGKGSTVDFKMRYAAKEETGGVKTYNDEVDTWYYEIWMQQKDQEAQYLTATTSWAAYVIDAPIKSGFEGRECRFGVRAVSPDGIKKSDISWSDYKEIAYDTPSSEVVLDRQVVKPGETFTVGLEDAMADPAQSWKVTNAETGKVVKTAENVKSFELAIDELGVYDVTIVDSKGVEQVLRGKIHVSPEETGAVPVVNTVSVDKTKAETSEALNISYTSRDGEGKVSRGVQVKDPNMLMIPGEIQQGMSYSYALWVKVDNYAHDKQGTNLINKNTVADKWPHNNWGDLWVQVRPAIPAGQNECRQDHAANEVSFNTMGWTGHDSPRESMMTTGYSLNPGVWNHICVTQGADCQQKIYFNGKCVAGPNNFANSTRREDNPDSRIDRWTTANIFIGGGGVYKAGLNATIDEVQVWNKPLTDDEVKAAMKGFADGSVPEGLQGYYTFEDYNKADSTFANHGHAGAEYVAKMVFMDGSGGENTASAAYKKVASDNNLTGYPGIPGTLEVKTDRKWLLAGARISSETDKAAVITYAREGSYEAGVQLTNFWGESSKMVDDAIEITEPTAINGVDRDAQFSVYPNPFVESVNFRFAEGGVYTINIVSASGALLQTNSFNAGAGEAVNVAVTGGKGLYVVQVMKDGKLYKAVNVVKK